MLLFFAARNQERGLGGAGHRFFGARRMNTKAQTSKSIKQLDKNKNEKEVWPVKVKKKKI